MSTIPITFNETIPSYTVIGGKERLRTFSAAGLSVVLLNRGGRYARRHIFDDFEKTGFDSVVSIEPEPAHYDLNDLSAEFPFVRFILIKGTISLGDQINLAVSELNTPLFYVMWNDMKPIAGGNARRMAERLITPVNGAGEAERSPFRRLCTVPVIQSSRFETIPTLRAPGLRRKKMHVMPLSSMQEGHFSLYPFDGTGIYDRDRFIKLGGFDGAFKSSYWQLMDFGFRAHLWGEEISVTQKLKLSYESEVPAEDDSTGDDFNRFYLKNLAPLFRGDCARLPLGRFPGYVLKANGGIIAAWEEFMECRRWVYLNRYRWKCDPTTLADNWNPDTGDP